MRYIGLLLGIIAMLAFVGCGDEAPVSATSDEAPATKLTVSAIKAGGYKGPNRPEPALYKSMLIYGLGHSTIASMAPGQVAQMLDNMGLNHVVFGGMPYDPEPLNSIVDELHKRGIKVYGECTQFSGWDADNPASQPTNAEGEPLPQVEWYQGANPSDPEVFDKALAKFKNAVDTHPGLDGMWTDFIRWPIHWEVRDWEEGIDPYIYDTSFDAATLARFEEATGIDIPDDLATIPEQAQWIYDNVHDEWGQWKCSIINRFCEEAHAYLKSKDPDKVLGAFTVPWKVSDYDGAILKIVGQDYAAMSQWVEVWSPMTYYDMMDYSIEWIGEFTTYCKQVTGRPTIPIIMGFSISLSKYGDELTPEELYDSIITTATAEGSDGVMMFWYNSILDENRLDEVIEAYAELP